MSAAELAAAGGDDAAAGGTASSSASLKPEKGLSRVTSTALTITGAVLCTFAALGIYDRHVVQPGLRLGIVDVGEVYRQREAEFTRMVTDAGSAATPQAEQARAQALAMAQQFARRLPAALQELAQDCACLVLQRSAVAGAPAHAQDLTALLRQKLERP